MTDSDSGIKRELYKEENCTLANHDSKQGWQISGGIKSGGRLLNITFPVF